MKESIWGYLILVLAIVVIVVLLLIQRITTTTEEDFYLGREIMEASMIDAVDYGTFRLSGKVVMSKEKFVEVFIRRFAENVTNNKDYQLDFYDIYEEPPKATVRIRTVSGESTINSDVFDIKLDTYMHGILETVYGIEYGTNPTPTTTGKGSGQAGTGALAPFGDDDDDSVTEKEDTPGSAPALQCNYQTIESNKNITFANGANLRDYGCGYTSISMAVSALGKNVSPSQVASDIWNKNGGKSSTIGDQNTEVCKNGGSTSTCGRVTTSTLTNPDLLNKYGVTGTKLFDSGSSETAKKQAVTDALNRGETIILRIPNHYIAISGSPDKVQLCNPWAGEQNGTYTIDSLFSNSAITNWHGKCSNTNECGIWYGASYKNN